MSEPTTEAGRALLQALFGLGVDNDEGEALHDILAIENEARASQPLTLDVDGCLAELAESPLPGARYAFAVVKRRLGGTYDPDR